MDTWLNAMEGGRIDLMRLIFIGNYRVETIGEIQG